MDKVKWSPFVGWSCWHNIFYHQEKGMFKTILNTCILLYLFQLISLEALISIKLFYYDLYVCSKVINLLFSWSPAGVRWQ